MAVALRQLLLSCVPCLGPFTLLFHCFLGWPSNPLPPYAPSGLPAGPAPWPAQEAADRWVVCAPLLRQVPVVTSSQVLYNTGCILQQAARSPLVTDSVSLNSVVVSRFISLIPVLYSARIPVCPHSSGHEAVPPVNPSAHFIHPGEGPASSICPPCPHCVQASWLRALETCRNSTARLCGTSSVAADLILVAIHPPLTC